MILGFALAAMGGLGIGATISFRRFSHHMNNPPIAKYLLPTERCPHDIDDYRVGACNCQSYSYTIFGEAIYNG